MKVNDEQIIIIIFTVIVLFGILAYVQELQKVEHQPTTYGLNNETDLDCCWSDVGYMVHNLFDGELINPCELNYSLEEKK